MEQRDRLYKEAMAMIKVATPHKKSILYHNIYSLKVDGGYPFSSQNDVIELVDFLNSY